MSTIIESREMNARIIFCRGILGMTPGKKEIHEKYIASKAPDAKLIDEEIAERGLNEVINEEKNVFPRTEEGIPFIYDYQWKGYFKEKCAFIAKIPGTKSSTVKAYKKLVDGRVFVQDRRNIINGPVLDETCQRTLRASTPQGERISLANSEEIPYGSTTEMTVETMTKSEEDLVREWLSYGIYHGTGQWRSSGKGRFFWVEVNDAGEVVGGNAKDYLKKLEKHKEKLLQRLERNPQFAEDYETKIRDCDAEIDLVAPYAKAKTV